MKKVLAVVVAGLFVFGFTGFAMAKGGKAPKGEIVKECKKDGTKCTADELKDKKLKKECKHPCPSQTKESEPPPAPPAGDPAAPAAGQ